MKLSRSDHVREVVERPGQKLGEVFKFSKQAEQRIAKLTDAELVILVVKNWHNWSSAEKKDVSIDVPLDELPHPFLQTTKVPEAEVKLFRKLEGAEGVLQKDDVIVEKQEHLVDSNVWVILVISLILGQSPIPSSIISINS